MNVKQILAPLLACCAVSAAAEVLYGHPEDAEVQNTLSSPPRLVISQASSTLISGCAGTVGKERCPVIPLQLPDFGAVNDPFTEASFRFHYAAKNNTVKGNVDLYGLGRRAGPEVLTNDYWTATSTVDPTDAVLLARDVIAVNSMSFGLRTISNAALVDYLNAQYAGGAGAGEYVFFRLSTDTAQTGGSSRYLITSADAGTEETAPRLVYPTRMMVEPQDADVQLTQDAPPLAVINETADTLIVGSAGGLVNGNTKERCAVMPFQLPDFGADSAPFRNAAFTFDYKDKFRTVLGNVDLYGLDRRTTPTVLTNDYWTATGAADPSEATLIAQDVITEDSTAYGMRTISNSALVDYLNAQYANGAGAGDYVFLRLGSDALQTGGANRYYIASAEGGTSETMPHIVYNGEDLPDDSSARPFIWVRESDKADILSKIAGHPWAQTIFNGMVARVAGEVSDHQGDRDGFLRDLPVLWSANPPVYKTYPAYSEARGGSTGMFDDAVDCAVLYYLTGDKQYARLAADILHNAIHTMLPVPPSTSVGNGGWINQIDLLYEVRVMGTQLPIIYDFVHTYLQSHQVYDVDSGGMVDFSFSQAQDVFRTYYTLTRDHGSKDTNWSAIMSTCMLNCLLALDDETERDAALHVYLATGSSRQASLDYDYRHYTEPGDIWPESLQYASGVGTIRTSHMVLLERVDPSLSLFDAYPNLPLSLSRIRDFLFPNKTEQITFGDGHRQKSGEPFFEYEMVYRHATARGYDTLATRMGELINGGIADNTYDRSELHSYANLGQHNEPLQLLWQAPEVTEAPAPLVLPRTDRLPYAGIALQRNESPDGNGNHALMGFVGGSAHVHSHACGMNMELYGMGQVMGAKGGRTSYTDAITTDYYRLFAANNTVIVNGSSRGEGGWKGLSINTVATVSMEPLPFAAAVSSNLSFTCSSFNDNKGDGAEATQQRTLAIVRTSDTSGFYVDMFRTKSTVRSHTATTLEGHVTDQYHDYIYRNIGELAITLETNNAPLPLYDQPNRFANDIGDEWGQPGWRYFVNTTVSYPHRAALFAQFMATPSGQSSIYMDMHMPAVATREVANVDSPPIVEAPNPYQDRDSPTLVIRKIGDAWDEPFVSVFEPHYRSTGGTIQETTALWRGGIVVGIKVESLVAGNPVTHYVIANPSDGQTYTDNSIGLSFQGRFGVAADFGPGEYELYIGDGRSMTYRGNTLASVSGDTEASMMCRAGLTPTVTANSAVQVTAASAPMITTLVPANNGLMSFTASGAIGVPYRVWSTARLPSDGWIMLRTGTVTNDPFTVDNLDASEGRSFYRLSTP